MYVSASQSTIEVWLIFSLGSNCNAWNGGSMTFNDSSSSWIWAMRNGDPIASDSQSANVQQHDNNEPFTIDLTKAAGGNSINPFIQSSTNTTSGAAPATTTATTSGGSDSESSTKATRQVRIHAHGLIMSISMLYVFFPISRAFCAKLLGYYSHSVRSLYVCSP